MKTLPSLPKFIPATGKSDTKPAAILNKRVTIAGSTCNPIVQKKTPYIYQTTAGNVLAIADQNVELPTSGTGLEYDTDLSYFPQALSLRNFEDFVPADSFDPDCQQKNFTFADTTSLTQWVLKPNQTLNTYQNYLALNGPMIWKLTPQVVTSPEDASVQGITNGSDTIWADDLQNLSLTDFPLQVALRSTVEFPLGAPAKVGSLGTSVQAPTDAVAFSPTVLSNDVAVLSVLARYNLGSTPSPSSTIVSTATSTSVSATTIATGLSGSHAHQSTVLAAEIIGPVLGLVALVALAYGAKQYRKSNRELGTRMKNFLSRHAEPSASDIEMDIRTLIQSATNSAV